MTTPLKTAQMLQDLGAAVDNLTHLHQQLAAVIAEPKQVAPAPTLDEILQAINAGNVQLETAEIQRQEWIAGFAPQASITAALTASDHPEHHAAWLNLQPRIETLHDLMQRHQLVVDRLAFFLRERVNILTQEIDPADAALYAASGKTTTPPDRRRSLGDA